MCEGGHAGCARILRCHLPTFRSTGGRAIFGFIIIGIQLYISETSILTGVCIETVITT